MTDENTNVHKAVLSCLLYSCMGLYLW